jgi:GNAT superfamily N-acetyltransferase
MREAGQADVPELVGLMRAFYDESGFTLDDARAVAAFRALLADGRLGRVWLIEHDTGAAGVEIAAVPEEPAPVAAPDEPVAVPPAAGYIVVTYVFAMEYGGMTCVGDDFYVRPEARGEGLGKAALAEARRACLDLAVPLRPVVGERSAQPDYRRDRQLMVERPRLGGDSEVAADSRAGSAL